MSGLSDGAGSAPNVGVFSSEGSRPTYRYGVLGFSTVAAPTDVLVIQGSASKTIRVKKVTITGVATAAANMPAQLIRRSTAGTLGSAVLTPIGASKHDINDASATATVSSVGTANYGVLGASAGTLGAGRIQLTAAATGLSVTPLSWEFATRQDKAVILRGVSDFLCVNLNGGALPLGAVIDFELQTEEDNS